MYALSSDLAFTVIVSGALCVMAVAAVAALPWRADELEATERLLRGVWARVRRSRVVRSVPVAHPALLLRSLGADRAR